MAVFRVGDIIRKTRLELGITQEDLCDGVCNMDSLSKIENNKQVPSKMNFDALMQRMGQSGEMYYAFANEKEYNIHEAKNDIRKFVAENRLDEAEGVTYMLETYIDDKINRQFIEYIRAIAAKHNQVDPKKVLSMLIDAIHLTVPKYGEESLVICFLTYEELSIINEIAHTYFMAADSASGISLLYELKDYMDEKYMSMDDKAKIYPVVLFDLAEGLLLAGRYIEVMAVCEKAANVCIDYGKMQFYPEIMFIEAQALISGGEIEKGSRRLHQAYHIFEAVDNKESAGKVREYAKTIGLEEL